MALIRWQPFREIETLRHQFDELFNELAGSKRESEMTWMPLVELQDTDENLILRAQLPGLEAKDLDVQVTRDAVLMAGEHRYENKAEEKGYFRSEFRYGKFQRVIPLPVQVRNERVQAEFKNGILTLTLPKVEEAQRRAVRINLGDSSTIASADSSKTLEASGEQLNGHNSEQTRASEPAMAS
ncbi:MAG: Hsp20/alpha crystallin family protein [Microcoleus vaginatus WJT46-NPBG5]|jgi:HSP20 family protein|nr:Hsp20/alpha crystallin family protein [Microcoleus vaginatus WJT46-NPBG5]